MELNEYILHRNETGESGSEIVFMAKDKYNVQTRTKNSMLELNTNELLEPNLITIVKPRSEHGRGMGALTASRSTGPF